MGTHKQIHLIYHGIVNSKKNSKQIVRNWRTGAPMVMTSAAAQRNAKDMIIQFVKQITDMPPGSTNLMAPLSVSIVITQKDRIRRDLDNQATSILDALVAAKVIPDDRANIVQELKVSLGGYDKYDPNASITISEI